MSTVSAAPSACPVTRGITNKSVSRSSTFTPRKRRPQTPPALYDTYYEVIPLVYLSGSIFIDICSLTCLHDIISYCFMFNKYADNTEGKARYKIDI